MRTGALFFVICLFLSTGAFGESGAPPPDWIAHGFEAALADSDEGAETATRNFAGYLAKYIPSGAGAGAVVDKLLPFLAGRDSNLQIAALQALGTIPLGERGGAVVDQILPLFADGDSDVRSTAGETLGAIARNGRAYAVIDKLLPLLGDGDGNVRSASAQALRTIPPGERAGAVIDKLLPLLGDSDSSVRSAAALALSSVPLGERASTVIDKLLPLLELSDSNESSVRRATAQALSAIPLGERAGTVINKLLTLLGDSDSNFGYIRTAAVQALGSIPLGEYTDIVIDKVVPLVVHRNIRVRNAAFKTIDAITKSEHAGAVIDKLLPLFAIDNVEVFGIVEELFVTAAKNGKSSTIIDKLVPLLSDTNYRVGGAAAQALGAITLGERSSAVIEKLLSLLGDGNGDTRGIAAQALGSIPLGERAGVVIDKLLPLLGDSDTIVRGRAAEALGTIPLGEHAGTVIDKLLPLLGDSDSDIRSAAAEALSVIPLGDRSGAVIEKLLPLLGDSNSNVRCAVHVLSTLPPGDRADAVIDKLLALLGDSDSAIRSAAVQALSAVQLGERTGALIDKLLPLLDDSDTNARSATVQALGTVPLGERAGVVIDQVLPLLDDGDSSVRSVTAQALSTIPLGARVGAVIEGVLPLLADGDSSVRSAAVLALNKMPLSEHTDVIMGTFVSLLTKSKIDERTELSSDYFSNNNKTDMISIMLKVGPGGISTEMAAIKLINTSAPVDGKFLRVAALIATGGNAKNDQSDTLLAWLGKPQSIPIGMVTGNAAAAERVLALFLTQWPELSTVPAAQMEAEDKVMKIIYAACPTSEQESSIVGLLNSVAKWFGIGSESARACWTSEQRTTVELLYAEFKKEHSTHEKALAEHLARENVAPVGKWISWSLAGWVLLWGTFLFGFPWSPTIQSIFFWNPRVREMMSLWFVPILLLVFPFLRRRLLIPFREDLLSGAQPKTFARIGFFSRGNGRLDGGTPASLETTLAQLRGTVVVRGEAGLGKTSALRWLALNSSRPVAFLHARECIDGVDTAIAAIVHQVQETSFVRSMVYTRAMTVIIDGLNEVSAETRERVGAFARDMSKGDVFIGTQPIEWQPPKGARILDLMPLDRDEAQQFLLSRPIGADSSQKRYGEVYATAVTAFVHHALDEAPSVDERRAAELMLSNPFDLAFAAELLAQGTMPQATSLIDAAFRFADEGTVEQPGYRTVCGQPFPLVPFGKLAVAMRLEDRNWFKDGEFSTEIPFLLAWKLLVSRAVGGSAERVQFRHDRVWDFFIAAAFRDDPELWLQHIGDPRFRGAYLRIAETWEPSAARQVRDELNVKAAQTGDHTTSDEFIRRLEARRRELALASTKKSS